MTNHRLLTLRCVQNDWFDEKKPHPAPLLLGEGNLGILRCRVENSHNQLVLKSSILLEFKEFDAVNNLAEL
jgi:hypothetical protein